MKKKPNLLAYAALAVGGYLVYQWAQSTQTVQPNPGDPATMNTGSLNSLPGLTSMHGLGGCGCKKRRY